MTLTTAHLIFPIVYAVIKTYFNAHSKLSSEYLQQVLNPQCQHNIPPTFCSHFSYALSNQAVGDFFNIYY